MAEKENVNEELKANNQKEFLETTLGKIINEARSIENLHILIKNNGQNFDLTKEQLELSQKI